MGGKRYVARKVLQALLTLVFVLVFTASEARADGWISPFFGWNFGGDAGRSFSDIGDDNMPITWGGDLGWMGSGVFGAELDFAYTKDFFETGPGVSDNTLMTLLPTLLIGVPFGGQRGLGIRPFGTAGLGWVKRDLTVDGSPVYDDKNDLAYTFGAGVMGFFSNHVGIRGDYKFVRAFSKDDFEANSEKIARFSVELYVEKMDFKISEYDA